MVLSEKAEGVIEVKKSEIYRKLGWNSYFRKMIDVVLCFLLVMVITWLISNKILACIIWLK